MSGRTGKRAYPAKLCALCGAKIVGDFMRVPKGDDYHKNCWWIKFHPESPHAQKEGGGE